MVPESPQMLVNPTPTFATGPPFTIVRAVGDTVIEKSGVQVVPDAKANNGNVWVAATERTNETMTIDKVFLDRIGGFRNPALKCCYRGSSN